MKKSTHSYLLRAIFIFTFALGFYSISQAQDSEPLACNACFTANGDTAPTPISGCATFTVNFNSSGCSSGFPGSRLWDFGDGVGTSTIANPTYDYPVAGTYIVTLVFSGGTCGANDTASMVITVYPTPTACFTGVPTSGCGPTPVCFTDCSSGGTPPYSYLWDFGDGGTDTVASPCYTYNTPGTYNVTLQVTDTNGCTNTLVLSSYITITPPPAANFTLSDTVECSPLIVSFTNTSTDTCASPTWLWDFGDATFSALSNPPPKTYATCGNYTISLTVTCPGCPVNIKSQGVTVYCTPAADFSMSTDTVCPGETIIFCNTSTGTSGTSTYSWSFAGGAPASSSTGGCVTVTYPATGTYTAQLIVTNNPGNCKDTIIKTVEVRTAPTAGFTVIPMAGCEDLTVTITNTSVGATICNWDFGDTGTLSSCASPFTYTYITPGSYTITLAVSNGGCTDTFAVGPIVVSATPNASFTQSADTVCERATVCFGNTSTGTVGGVTYLWNFGDGSPTDASLSPCHTYNNGAVTGCDTTYTVTLIVTNPGPCPDTITSTVTILNRPQGTWMFTLSPPNACEPNDITFTNTTPFSACIDHYEWEFVTPMGAVPCDDFATPGGSGWDPGALPGTPGDPWTCLGVSAGTYVVRLITFGINSCDPDTNEQTIIISPVPIPSFTMSTDSVCERDQMCFGNTSGNTVAGTTYFWDFGDGGTSVLENPCHTYDGLPVDPLICDTTVTITFIVTNPGGCADTTTGTVVVLKRPKGNFTAVIVPIPACEPVDITFDNITLFSSCIDHYEWNFIPFMGPVPCANFSTAAGSGWDPGAVVGTPGDPFTCIGITAGLYTVRLITFGTAGCLPDTMEQMLVVSVTPTPDFTYSDTVCERTNTCFTNTSSDTAAAGTTWYWDFGDGTTSTLKNPCHVYDITMTACDTTLTVRLGVTNPGGCTDTISQSIVVLERPKGTFTATPPGGCEPLDITFENTTAISACIDHYEWQFVPPMGAVPCANFSTAAGSGWDPGAIIGTPGDPWTCTSIMVGTYIVRLLTYGINACNPDTMEMTIIVGQTPVPDFTASPNPVCVNDLVTFTNTTTNTLPGVTWFWDFGDATTSTLQNPTHAYTVAGVYGVILTATNPNGCDSSITITVTVVPLPTASFIADPDTGCVPLRVGITNTSICGGGCSYVWSWGDGPPLNDTTSLVTGFPYFHDYTVAGTYIMRLIVISASGCRDTTTATIVVYPTPTADFTGTPTVGCTPMTVTFTNLSTNGTSYYWVFGDGDDSTTTSTADMVHIYTTGGVYTVSLTVTGFGACAPVTATKVSYINVANTPVASFTTSPVGFPPPGPCMPITVNFTNTSTFGTSYDWDFGDFVGTSTATNPSYTYTTATVPFDATVTIRLIVTGGNGCKDTAYASYDLRVAPVADFSVDNPTPCSGDVVTFTNLSTGASACQWDFGDATNSFSCGPTVTHTYVTPGTYPVTLTVSAANGCNDSETKSAFIVCSETPQSIFTWTGDDSGPGGPVPDLYIGCGPFTVDATYGATSGIPIDSIVWNVYDSVTSTFGGNLIFSINGTIPPLDLTYIFNPAYADTFRIELVVWNTADCFNSTDQVYIIQSQPVPDFSNTADTCLNEPITFNNLSTGGANDYTWDFGDATSITILTNDSVTHTYSTNGQYTVTLTQRNNCDTVSIAKPLIITIESPLTDFTVSDDSICTEDSILFTDLTPAGVFFANSTYSWTFPGGNPATASTSTPPYVIYNTVGTYIATLTVTNTSGCDSTITMPVVVGSGVQPNFLAPGCACTGDSACFINNSLGGGPFFWNWGDASPIETTLTAPSTVCHLYAAAGSYSITMTQSNGCETDSFTTSTALLVEGTVPPIFTPQNLTITAPDTMVNFVNNTFAPNYSFFWVLKDSATGNVLGSSDQFNFSYSFLDEGTYYITLRSQSPTCFCVDIDTAVIRVVPSLFIPNVFTPNDDEINDRFWIRTSYRKDYQIQIFDRWGILQFEGTSPDYNDSWDGTNKGRDCAEGVYYYMITIGSGGKKGLEPGNPTEKIKKSQHVGWVTLLR